MKPSTSPGILSRPQDVTMPPQDEPNADQEAWDAQVAKITPDQWDKIMVRLKALADKQPSSRGALSASSDPPEADYEDESGVLPYHKTRAIYQRKK